MLVIYLITILWAAACGFSVLALTRNSTQPFPTIHLVAWAILFRLIGWYGLPVLEDDYYRYLWDGYRFVTEGSPYGFAPIEFFSDESLPTRFAHILGQINHPDVPTIYGPTLEYLFGLAYLISPGELWGLKLLLICADLALIGILLTFANPRWVLLYAWCPLVIKEIAFTAHPDGFAVLLLFTALALQNKNQLAGAAIFLAMSVAAKVFALLLVPFVLAKAKPKHWFIFVSTILGLYAPFILIGGSDFTALGIFAQNWEFNPALYLLIKQFLPAFYAKALLGLVFLGWLFMYFWQYRQSTKICMPRGDWIFGLFLLIAPVINVWYLLWLLPFAVLYPSAWAWSASVALSLSYIVGLNLTDSSLNSYQMPVWAQLLEWSIIALALIFDLYRKNFSRKISRA